MSSLVSIDWNKQGTLESPTNSAHCPSIARKRNSECQADFLSTFGCGRSAAGDPTVRRDIGGFTAGSLSFLLNPHYDFLSDGGAGKLAYMSYQTLRLTKCRNFRGSVKGSATQSNTIGHSGPVSTRQAVS